MKFISLRLSVFTPSYPSSHLLIFIFFLLFFQNFFPHKLVAQDVNGKEQVRQAEDYSQDAPPPEEDISIDDGKIVKTADPSRFYMMATVRVLNKITAKTELLNLKIDQKINFGTLRIIAHKCWKAPLDKRPENKVLLEIFELKNEEKKEFEKRIFYGWMFSSSPSLSGIEHPIYDVSAINCWNN